MGHREAFLEARRAGTLSNQASPGTSWNAGDPITPEIEEYLLRGVVASGPAGEITPGGRSPSGEVGGEYPVGSDSNPDLVFGDLTPEEQRAEVLRDLGWEFTTDPARFETNYGAELTEDVVRQVIEAYGGVYVSPTGETDGDPGGQGEEDPGGERVIVVRSDGGGGSSGVPSWLWLVGLVVGGLVLMRRS